jgi:membrane protease YdiL (CAAX protease family)
MYSFNEKIKNITLKELLTLLIALFLIYFALNELKILNFSSVWIYFFIILFFTYKLRDCFSTFKEDFRNVFAKKLLKNILIVVVLNIFISYGFLYLSGFILEAFPSLGDIVNFTISSGYLCHSLMAVGGFIATVVVSPISEELIFRGVLFNRLKLIVPTVISILIVSLLFAAMHSYGNISAAFIFAICMSILYLKTDNILVPIFAHFLNNLMAETIVFVDSGSILFTNGVVMGFVSILAVISFIVILRVIIKELNSIK